MMIHPPFKTAPELSTLDRVRHGFFGTRGGVSEGLYASLNLGPGSDDKAQNIRTNRQHVCQAMQAEHLLSCFQVHGCDVVCATEPWSTRPKADAMVTKTPGLGLCILTADCAPVLFADQVAGVIGAAHAGWKGTLAGVIEATLEHMLSLGATTANIKAAIGPAIQQDSYEVGPEFRQNWLTARPWTETCFISGQADRWHFDLTACIMHILEQASIASERLADDTFSMDGQYFSNRRRTHRNEPDYGRNGSVIVLA